MFDLASKTELLIEEQGELMAEVAGCLRITRNHTWEGGEAAAPCQRPSSNQYWVPHCTVPSAERSQVQHDIAAAAAATCSQNRFLAGSPAWMTSSNSVWVAGADGLSCCHVTWFQTEEKWKQDYLALPHV